MSVARSALVLILAGTAVPAFADQITCHSTQDRPEPCSTVQPGSTVTLARQLGPTRCVEGRTWGTGPDRDSIWVSRGCSAVFDVQPPGGSQPDDRMAGDGAQPDGGRSPEWQRGFDDGRRGNADPNATSQDYLEGFRAGEDTARDASRYGARSAPPRASSSGNPGVFESVPNPPPDRRNAPVTAQDGYVNRGSAPQPNRNQLPGDDRYPPPGAYDPRRDEHYASIDQRRSIARRACIDAAAQDRRYDADRIISRDVRWIGYGNFEVHLATPEGGLICTVDRDGNVQSIDDR